ncbi:diacylglycerol cholinephosphotransferase Ecym_8190 [Eremothecium cymbalariae DBVPG|uniref:diacylglycerol cholinephosphotransferase n=1 Tax=Eremothecium cymbalariae (strain CBS 270.75 / DBVPG 7215 / KCTC 17166 / NRRL Y-17582) TaxID=931890 RepID=G8JXA1_ERECY|nr:Hypothetical protein Ecym_8190 [Eremothecium cymbalariae DBVPG\
MGVFIPHSKLKNLKDYSYQSEDRSLISKYVLKPFWAKFVNIFPLWMAPNAVTLTGFGFIIVNVLTALYFNPNLDTESPRWTYFSYAIGLFLYQTFDACDGAHARRTSQSGPLGELFDHSIDSLNTTLSILVFCAVVNCGYTFLTLLIQFALLCNFYLSTWEEYHTHKLFLSEFSGPVEGILLIVLSFILTGIYGPQKIWHTRITELNFVGYSYEVESQHVVYGLCGLGLIFNILSARRNVVKYYHQKYGASASTTKQVVDATWQLVPFFAFFASLFITGVLEPSFISLPTVLSSGLTVAFTVGRIIVAHLTIQQYPMNNIPMYIPTVSFMLKFLFVNLLGYQLDQCLFALSWLGFGLSLGIHAMFIMEVIYEFTNYLDIYVLSIKHPKIA